MNPKDLLQQELDAFMLAVADSYSELVIRSIPDEKFDRLVQEIKLARDKTLNNLTSVMHLNNDDNQLENDMAPLKLEGPTPPLPRQVDEVTVYPKEEAVKFIAAAGRTGSLADIIGEDEAIEHTPPAITIAEERRIAAGLPQKLHRPHIHIDHTGKREGGVPLQAVASASVSGKAPSPARDLFEQIRVVVAPLLKEKNGRIRDIGFAITALTAQGLALNYEEETNG